MTRTATSALLLLALTAVIVSPAAAQSGGDGGGGVTIINLDEVADALNELLEKFSGFTENWDKVLADTLKSVLYEPFQALAGFLISPVVNLLTATPTVHPNPAVEDVHQDVLLVTYLLSGLAFVAAGLLHMIGPVLGFSYNEVRKILPRVVIAMVFSAVSLPLLQLAVDFTDALTHAFKPGMFSLTFTQLIGLSTGLVLAYILQALLLIAVAILFIIRDIYILFVAAVSPLLALTWSIPRVKRYADTFIAGWFAALMIAPLDVLVLKFSFALMSGAGTSLYQGVTNWLLGIASLVLLLLVPKQVWEASQSAVGMTYSATKSVKKRLNTSDNDSLLSQEQRQRLRENRKKRRISTSTDISYPWRDDS